MQKTFYFAGIYESSFKDKEDANKIIDFSRAILVDSQTLQAQGFRVNENLKDIPDDGTLVCPAFQPKGKGWEIIAWNEQ